MQCHSIFPFNWNLLISHFLFHHFIVIDSAQKMEPKLIIDIGCDEFVSLYIFFLSLEKKNDELSFSSRREKEKKKKEKEKS